MAPQQYVADIKAKLVASAVMYLAAAGKYLRLTRRPL